jgi:DNA primase
MAKAYIDTVKYLIKANFEVDGMIEKPDIVGAVFGQTEGLLGDELDLRELQKNGRIGRIEVDTQVKGGKTFGTIVIPSSLDMVETSILAASLEVVDRVGPCDARIKVGRIEDSRNLKRKLVLDRAKNLLKTMLVEEIPESKELSEMVRDDVKTAEIGTYGEEQLPAGPDIRNSDAIVLVEGRADVLNLLRNNIKNVVAVGGANVGKTIANLCREKEVTVFLDGDRGGDIILRELMNATELDYVARAPPGKEVEELTRKEIIKCLRRRVSIEQFDSNGREKEDRRGRPEFRERRREYRREWVEKEHMEREPAVQEEKIAEPVAPVESPEIIEKIEAAKSVLKELEGSLKAKVLDENLNVLAETQIRDLMKAILDAEGAYAVVLDGIITQRLIDLAEEKGIKLVIGLKAGTITRKSDATRMVLAE